MTVLLQRAQIAGPGGLLVLGVALAGLAAALLFASYPLSYVDGSHPFWQDPTGDLAQHSTGANYFLLSDWSYPLFHVAALGIPDGTSIVYTDSLPLMALATKLLSEITGETPLYFSTWIVISALLQAPCFALALYAAGVRDAAVLALGGALALFAPVWWFNFSHLQLFGHFMILVAIALYFFAMRSERGPLAPLACFVPLLVAAMLVSGYMFLMVGMLFGLTLLGALWRGRLSAPTALAALAVAGGLAAAVLVIGGYLGTALVPKNFGLFSLNLLGPVTPQLSGIVPGLDDFVLDATGGQSQGFAYLGLGVLLLTVVALAAARGDLGAGLRADPTLPLGMLAILLYAASYAVYAGPLLIAGISYTTVRETFLGLAAGDIAPAQALAALGALDYLRLALLAIIAAALPLSLAALAWRAGKRDLLVVLAILAVGALAVFAISPKRVLYGLATLHASGRFVWPLVYLVMVLAIAGLARRLPPLPLAGLLAAALAIQVVDSGPAQERVRKEIAEGEGQAFADAAAVAGALEGAERFVISPNFHCVNLEMAQSPELKAAKKLLVRLEFLASKSALPINSVLNARLTTAKGLIELPDCDAERAKALAGGWGAGTATYFIAAATPPEALARLAATPDRRCRTLAHGVLCEEP